LRAQFRDQLLFLEGEHPAVGVMTIIHSSVPNRWCEIKSERSRLSVTMPPR